MYAVLLSFFIAVYKFFTKFLKIDLEKQIQFF